MTLEQLAESSKLTPNYIGTIENGYRDPSLSTLQGLADGLNVPLAELFGPPQSLTTTATSKAAAHHPTIDRTPAITSSVRFTMLVTSTKLATAICR